jgi:hypothetical protein
VSDPRVEDREKPVSTDGLGVCGVAHAEPAWLGAIRGTEWWHCRSCGWVWHELRPVEPAEPAGETSQVMHRRE